MAMSKGSVLFVDDDPEILELFSKLCAHRLSGVFCAFAEDAAVALDVATGPPFDVIVTDLDMPGMDGVGLALQIRSRNPAAKIILYSGKALPADLPRELFSHVFQKPDDLEALLQAIRRALELIAST